MANMTEEMHEKRCTHDPGTGVSNPVGCSQRTFVSSLLERDVWFKFAIGAIVVLFMVVPLMIRKIVEHRRKVAFSVLAGYATSRLLR